MSIVKITSHAAEALANLLSQMQGKTTFESLLTVYADPCQDVEDTLYDMAFQRQLDTAEGANLDQYGKLVGAARRGLSDADYRRYIRVRIQANRSNGQSDAILDVVSILVGDKVVDYILYAPAAYLLQYEATPGITSELITLLSEILEQMTGAGIGYIVIEAPEGAKRFDTSGAGFDGTPGVSGLFGKSLIVSS